MARPPARPLSALARQPSFVSELFASPTRSNPPLHGLQPEKIELYRPAGTVSIERKSNCREILLDAAEAVVLESGSAHFTLEAVAEKATISKGGLLCHFPNKEALPEGLINRLHTRFENVRSELKAEFSGDPAGPLRAFVLAAFHDQAQQKRLSADLRAIAANNPKLLNQRAAPTARIFVNSPKATPVSRGP